MKHFSLVAMWFFALFFVSLSLVACGGESTPQPNPNDKTAPTLSSSLPAEGTNAVPINAKLGFAFSEAMDEGSLELTSNPAITLGNPTWNADSRSVAFANGNLATSTSYTLTVKAKDLAGNVLAPTTLSFTTSDTTDTTAPATPTGLVATPANGQVTLTWQDNPELDVVGYRLYMGTAQDKLESKDFVTTNSMTVTGLTNGTTYFFALDAVDGANNHSGQTASVSATPSATVTDKTPPTLQSSDPADNSTNVNPRNPSIKLVFSEPIDTASFSLTFVPFIFLALQSLEPAAITPFEVSWSEGDTLATLRLKPPYELLLENTALTLTISAKDRAGNALAGDNEINFTTGEEPRLVSSTPEDGATDIGVELFEIQLVFSKPMDTTTVKVEPTLEPVDISFYSQSWTLTWSADDTVLTLKTSVIPGYFLEDTTYILLLTGVDKTGIPLLDTTVTFTTVDDPTPPTITGTSPFNGTTDRPLSPLGVFVYFDDVMDEEATIGAISSSMPLPCEWRYSFSHSTGDKAFGTFYYCRSETESFEPDTTYTITVSTEATDTSGNALATPYSFSFKTVATTGALQVNIAPLSLTNYTQKP